MRYNEILFYYILGCFSPLPFAADFSFFFLMMKKEKTENSQNPLTKKGGKGKKRNAVKCEILKLCIA